MFGQFVKGKENIRDTECKPGGNTRDERSRSQSYTKSGQVKPQGGLFI